MNAYDGGWVRHGGELTSSVAKRTLKMAFPKLALYYKVYQLLVKNESSYLYLTGWIRSVEEGRPVDINGNQFPWMNYSIIKFLQDRLRNDFQLFEFGSGYSTRFYASLVRTVVSVEHDPAWFQVVTRNAPENIEFIYRENDTDGGYCRVVNSTGRLYDVVIVDGRDRVNCIRQSIKALSDRGVILLDDSQRNGYSEGIEYAKEQGFRALDFEGLKPTGWQIDKTTVFYRDGNCLGI